MPLRTFNKLVRDCIPDIIRAHGEVPRTRALSVREFRKALATKLLEEAKEFAKAKTKKAQIEELADIQEVMLALYAAHAIPCKKVTEAARKKRKTRGGFTKRTLLISTT